MVFNTFLISVDWVGFVLGRKKNEISWEKNNPQNLKAIRQLFSLLYLLLLLLTMTALPPFMPLLLNNCVNTAHCEVTSAALFIDWPLFNCLGHSETRNSNTMDRHLKIYLFSCIMLCVRRNGEWDGNGRTEQGSVILFALLLHVGHTQTPKQNFPARGSARLNHPREK